MSQPTQEPNQQPGRDHTVADPSTPRPVGGRLRDLRIPPRGALPRQLQTWLMAGIALVIVAIILITGHPEPPEDAVAVQRQTPPALAPPERIRSFQRQIGDDVLRQQQVIEADAARAEAERGAAASAGTRTSAAGSPRPSDALTDEERRRDATSLFADNVALSRRPAGQQSRAQSSSDLSPAALLSQPRPDDLARMQSVLQGAIASLATRGVSSASGPAGPAGLAPWAPPPSTPPPGTSASGAWSTSAPSTAPGDVPAAASPALSTSAPSTSPSAPSEPSEPLEPFEPLEPSEPSRHRLYEGTFIETVLLNRLDGTFAGPVTALVTTPVYTHDRRHLVIPAGARVIGSAAPVQAWGDSRLAVSFHRLLMPDGRSYSLEQFKGLSQIGEAGLRDEVDRHYFQVFGASLAIGALSGLAQYGTRGGLDAYSFGDAYRQSAGNSLANSTARVLDRYLNVLPTITIREGFRIKVYLTNDLDLPAYEQSRHGGTP